MRSCSVLYALFVTVLLIIHNYECYNSAKKWFNDFIHETRGNSLLRPAVDLNTPIIVYMNLSLAQIMEVNVKNQILILNVWIYLEWKDSRFKWSPKDYGMMKDVQIPANMIWLPDLVLYNNAGDDWDFAGMSATKVKVIHDGTIVWKPPVILKSQCDIDVTYFPFDAQKCILKMGTWSHNGFLIDLRHFQQKKFDSDLQNRFDSCESKIDYAIDLREYMKSYEWDLVGVSASRNIMKYPCCPEPYLDVTFQVTIQRMTLFYGLNLICPCLSISFMAILVFYLPIYAAEKITLCISVFLALTIFILVVFDLTPSTSRSVPLIVKYLLFTMIMVTISIVGSIVVLNISFRQPETNQMSMKMKRVFLVMLPKYLWMRPMEEQVVFDQKPTSKRLKKITDCSIYDLTWTRWNQHYTLLKNQYMNGEVGKEESEQIEKLSDSNSHQEGKDDGNTEENEKIESSSNSLALTQFYKRKLAMESLRSIQQHLRLIEERNKTRDEWVYMGVVIDRLMLFIYSFVVSIGSAIVFLSPPTLWSGEKPLTSDDAVHLLSSSNFSRIC